MCELLGMAFNETVQPNFSFRGFIHRGSANPDGWGIAYYPNGEYAAQVIKEPLQSNHSSFAAFLKDNKGIRSRIFISHVRLATSSVCYTNTHPFSRVLGNREYVFAHNGHLSGNYRDLLAAGRWNSMGTTDSEYAFCHLMHIIENRVLEWNEESFSLLENSMREINRFGNFNCLLSDGERLFCYRDLNGYKGLYFTKREAPFSSVKLVDEDYEIDLSEEKAPSQKGFIIATRPLTDEQWEELEPGRLTVIDKGTLVFPNKEREQQEQLIRILRFIRTAPHRVSIEEIGSNMGLTAAKMKPLIRQLRDDGFIRQDRRDTVEPFSPAATYYTVPGKRTEIDSLI
ncbi:MAG: class II glutamine amidotransferase [Firmicutes bacterium]|jgi:predicted glutamine amidotransferase|nr:class II glutamine amidotransferase [Bacillota bacterium]